MMNHERMCTVSLLILCCFQNSMSAPKVVATNSLNNNGLSLVTVLTPVVAIMTGITFWKVYQQQKELQSCRSEIKKLQRRRLAAQQTFIPLDDLTAQLAMQLEMQLSIQKELREFKQHIKDEITTIAGSLEDMVMRKKFEAAVCDNDVVILHLAGRRFGSDNSLESIASTQQFLSDLDVE